MIRSPASGIVIDKNAEEGSYVNAGTTVYRIADLSRVWLEAHIFEYELPWVFEGQEVEMRIPYEPGKVYTGRVSFVFPYLQQKTRDVVIRLEFENPDLALKPDMYADVWIKTGSTDKGLVIPSEAVIRSGERNIVFVAKPQGRFSPRNIDIGLSLDDGMVQVLSGVAPGEVVVTSGQFLLDSESKLKEAVQKMMEARKGPSAKPAEDPFFDDMDTDPDDFFDDMEDRQE
jgi:Cu(I)/Ag(I) efflux system membrane fusion protein/cobalt-zinc-cadmium efflux system membrane fusion protein